MDNSFTREEALTAGCMASQDQALTLELERKELEDEASRKRKKKLRAEPVGFGTKNKRGSKAGGRTRRASKYMKW